MSLQPCKRQKYPYRGEDGKLIWVGFQTMMKAGAFLERRGKTYRRAYDLERTIAKRSERLIERTSGLSDSMGFTKKGLEDRVKHLKKSGVRGIEFKEDPHVPGFYQVQYDSERSKMAYAKSLDMSDRNSKNGSGAMLSQDQLDSAKELLLRERPNICHKTRN